MHWRVLAVVLLAVVAGCGSVVGSGDSTETVTPVPVATPTPAASPIAVAPGVTTAGIEDVETLIESHTRIVRNTSFVWEEVQGETYTEADGAQRDPLTRRVVYESNSSYHRYVSALSPSGAGDFRSVRDYEHYAADGVTYARWDVRGRSGTEFERSTDHSPSYYLGVPRGDFQRFLTLDSETVSRVDVGERPHFEVRGTQSAVNGYGEVEDFRARAVVREDGLVRQVNVTFDATEGGEPLAVEFTSTYSRIGNASVTPPEWLSEAREQTEGSRATVRPWTPHSLLA